MTKIAILNRVNVSEVQPVKVVDTTQPAPARLTYALYQANRAAFKIDPQYVVHNDWHKQGLTTKEANDLIAEYNKVTGYVYAPKAKKVVTKQQKEPVSKVNASALKGAKAHPTKTPNQTEKNGGTNDLVAGQIQALKEMRKEGLLTVPELVEALKALQA